MKNVWNITFKTANRSRLSSDLKKVKSSANESDEFSYFSSFSYQLFEPAIFGLSNDAQERSNIENKKQIGSLPQGT